jgi:hypothetical protein
MAEHDFNTLMAALDSPLIIVSTADERERAGCLVEFHVQSSIEPQRYCVWLSKANYTYQLPLPPHRDPPARLIRAPGDVYQGPAPAQAFVHARPAPRRPRPRRSRP